MRDLAAPRAMNPENAKPQSAIAAPPASFRQVGIVPLLFLTYAYTTGGPFGYEAIFSLSGPGLGLLFLLAVPFLYSLPMSLAAMEMNSFLPVQGGFYRWVRAGGGDFWGFQSGWWNWTGTFLMNSAYGVLFMDYAGPYLGKYVMPAALLRIGEHNATAALAAAKWLGAALFLWLIAYANIRGIQVAGWMAIALQAAILIPVAWFCVAALGGWKHDPFTPFVPPAQTLSTSFGAGLALAIWLYSGYEQLSSVAEEVKDSRRTFARVLLWMTPLAILTYVTPALLGLAALGNWSEWDTGYMTRAAQQLGGPALGAAMLLASAISVASLSNSTVLSVSRVPYAMAQDGYLPRWLAALHPKYGTPARAIVMATVLCCALAVGNVVGLITVYIWTRIASSILTVLAAWQLRKRMPDAPRSFRIGYGALGMAYAVGVPALFCAASLVAIHARESSMTPPALALLATGPLAFLVFRWTLRPAARSSAPSQPASTVSRGAR